MCLPTSIKCRYTMRIALIILAFAGIVVSSLALNVHFQTGTQPCDINERWDCGVVNHSSYSMLLGVPVAAIGIAGFVALGLLAFTRHRFFLLASAVMGFLFALYLTNVEKNVLMVWCLYCVISQCIIALVLLLGIGWLIAGILDRRREEKLTQKHI